MALRKKILKEFTPETKDFPAKPTAKKYRETLINYLRKSARLRKRRDKRWNIWYFIWNFIHSLAITELKSEEKVKINHFMSSSSEEFWKWHDEMFAGSKDDKFYTIVAPEHSQVKSWPIFLSTFFFKLTLKCLNCCYLLGYLNCLVSEPKSLQFFSKYFGFHHCRFPNKKKRSTAKFNDRSWLCGGERTVWQEINSRKKAGAKMLSNSSNWSHVVRLNPKRILSSRFIHLSSGVNFERRANNFHGIRKQDK